MHGGSTAGRKLVLLAILAAVTGVYANHFHNGFHFDDSHAVVDNPYIRDLKNLPRFFTDATTFSVLPTNRSYRPIVTASLAFDYWLGGGYKPFWFHLGTFIIFIIQLVCMRWLFAAILRRASPLSSTQNELTALFATAWYGLHPAIAETVNYVIQRGDVYSTAGVVAALAMYTRGGWLRRAHLYLLPFALAMLSKPPALVFPFLLFFYLLWFEESGERPVANAARKSLPALVACGLLLWLQAAHTPKSFTPSMLSPAAYRLTQPYVWLRYGWSLLLPLHLNVDTDLGTLDGIDARMVAGFLFVIALVVAAVWCSRSKPLRPIAFGIVWFIIAELPTSLYPLSEVENDHRMYFAFVGLVLAASYGFTIGAITLSRKLGRPALSPRAAAALAVIFLAAYAQGTFARNKVWKDEETLWRDDVAKCPHNGRGLMNYGLTLMSRGDYQTALDLYTQALVYTPNYTVLEINLGIVNDALGHEEEADRHYVRAIMLSPRSDDGYFYYARSLYAHGRLAQAKTEDDVAISLNPSRVDPQHLLISIELAQGDSAQAQGDAEGLLQLAPGDVAAQDLTAHAGPLTASYWIELSLRQYQQKLFDASIVSSRRALQLEPNSAEAYNNIAAAAAEESRWDEAIAAAQEALRLNPDLQLAKNNLAWAQAGKAGTLPK